jgi:hypothetical protein
MRVSFCIPNWSHQRSFVGSASRDIRARTHVGWRETVMTLTADDIVQAALPLGEEPEPEPTQEPEQPRGWRWLA